MKKYVIRPGDTMYTISKKTGVRLPLLLAANPHISHPEQLQPGMTIVIPELGKPAKNQVPPPPASHKGPKEEAPKTTIPQYFGFVWPHVVQRDESAEQIAVRYGVTTAQIEMLNPNLSIGQPLQPGTVLYIPYMASPEAKKPKVSQPPPQPTNGSGPHTHAPYRDQESVAKFSYGIPSNWDGDVDESSSLMSSWDEWDEATQTRGKKLKPGQSADGWSQTFTIHHDEDD